jgi:hypothetical protein
MVRLRRVSFNLGAGYAHQLRHAGHFGREESGEFLRRAADRFIAKREDTFA